MSVNARMPWGRRAVLLGLHARTLFNVVSALSLLKRDEIPSKGHTITLAARVPFGW